jgi:FAD/FMN-containing dehydrogenase
MYRRTFCKSTLAAGIAATLPSTSAIAALSSTTQVVSNIAAVTGAGEQISLEKEAVQELKDSLSGSLLTSGDSAYESARHVWNGMIDKRPALIAICASPEDVANAVTFASERNLLLSVKGGGHSFPGKSTCDDGLMLDLSLMHNVEIDVDRKTATAGGGALLGHVDTATLKHELITTTGVVSHTGVGGFTLGGGMGRVDRKFGLAIDNLLAADLVTASGKIVHVSDDENTDLFWAIRGGGGNFGVVTKFVYRVHPFNPMVYGGFISYPFGQARDAWEFFAEYSETVPDECSLEPSMNVAPDGQRVFGIEVCYAGDYKKAQKVLAPLLAFGKPSSSEVGPKSYAEMQTSFDGIMAHGLQNYLKSGYMVELTPAAIDAMVGNYEGDFLPSAWIQHLGGVTARIDQRATAYAHREVHSNYGMSSTWTDEAESEQRIEKLRSYYAAIEPYTQGFYANLHEDTDRKTRGNYGVNYERLVEIKNKFDPTNLFRLNANIRPTV